MKKQYTEEVKRKILEFAEKNTIKKACEMFGVSKYAINEWKGYKRKNKKESNKKWYEKNGKDYYSEELNKQRHRENVFNWRKNNPEKTKDINKKTKQKRKFKSLCEYANRRYVQKNIYNFYVLKAFDLFKIAKKQKLICPLSGIKLTNENISLDHIIPFSKGGSNHPDNLRLIDKRINIALNTMTDKEYLDLCRTIVDFQNKSA